MEFLREIALKTEKLNGHLVFSILENHLRKQKKSTKNYY